MDPLSVTVSCLTLVKVIGKSATITTDFLKKCREGRRELAAFSGQLSQLEGILNVLHDEIQDNHDGEDIPEPVQDHLRSILSECFNLIEEEAKVLEEYDSREKGRVSWATSGRPRIEALNVRLDVFTKTLNMTVDIMTM